jgi:hypothetical protein
VNRFTQLADDSDEVPDLKNKKYRDFRLSKADWVKMELMREVLQVYHSVLILSSGPHDVAHHRNQQMLNKHFHP